MTITATLIAEFSRHNARIRAARIDYATRMAAMDGERIEAGGVESRRARLAADSSIAEHGRPATYTYWGCRCEPCRDAKRASWNRYCARKKARGGGAA